MQLRRFGWSALAVHTNVRHPLTRVAMSSSLRLAAGLAGLVLLSACGDARTGPGGRGAPWPPVYPVYALRTIDGAALPVVTGPDDARLQIDSAVFRFTTTGDPYGWTLTRYSGGQSRGTLVNLFSRRVSADSFVVDADVPGAPAPDMFLAVRDSNLVLYFRPPSTGASLAAFLVGRRNQNWSFKAR